MKFLTSEISIPNKGGDDYVADVFDVDYKIYKEPITKAKPKVEEIRKKVALTNNIKQVKNDFKLIDPQRQLVNPEQNTTDKKVKSTNTTTSPNKTLHINLVEQVPIFPGCEDLSSNSERKSCMSKKISRLVQRKFDTSIGADLGLSGKQLFHVQFKIDQKGYVTDIKTNAKYRDFDNEAKRVIGKIPKMQPGKQLNKNVAVIYNLPISFIMMN